VDSSAGGGLYELDRLLGCWQARTSPVERVSRNGGRSEEIVPPGNSPRLNSKLPVRAVGISGILHPGPSKE
jgi:hypothetical protein